MNLPEADFWALTPGQFADLVEFHRQLNHVPTEKETAATNAKKLRKGRKV